MRGLTVPSSERKSNSSSSSLLCLHYITTSSGYVHSSLNHNTIYVQPNALSWLAKWSFPKSACANVTIGAEIMRLSRQLDVVSSAKYSRAAQVVGLQKWSGTYLPRTCIKVLTVPCPIVFQQINTIVKCWEVTKVIICHKKIIVQRQDSFKWAFH